MQNTVLYIVTALLVVWSFMKDRGKTKKSLLKAWKAFENILPQFLAIIVLIGILLAVLDPATVSRIIGGPSGWFGVLLAALVGAITLIPGFIAFPLAAQLLQSGAGYMQIGAFVSSLMMVGIVTMPLEMRYFGRKATLLRNVLAFGFAFVAAFVLGKAMGEL